MSTNDDEIQADTTATEQTGDDPSTVASEDAPGDGRRASDDPEGGPADEVDAGDDGQAEEVEPTPVSDPRDLRIELLERRLADTEETLREYIRSYKRSQEDTDAFKQRLLRDQAREVAGAKAKVVQTLLDVADDLERSLEAARQGSTSASLLDGLQLVSRLLNQRMDALGLVRVDPTGETFDPGSMEAIGVVPVTNAEADGTVIQTLQVGFKVDDVELRPARVQVGKLVDGA